MRILFLNHKIPYPPNKGDRIPGYYRIKHLAVRHQVSLVFPCYREEELQLVDEVEKLCASVDTAYIGQRTAKMRCGAAFLAHRPITKAFAYSSRLKRRLDARLGQAKYDLIYVYSSAMAQYVEEIGDIPRVIDLADADSHKWLQYSRRVTFPMSWVYKREGEWLKDYERFLCETFDHAIAISQDEKNLFRTYIPDGRMSVVPNGVDFEYFTPREADHGSTKIVFTGVMSYFANVDSVVYFARQILPLVKERIPAAQFYIVGSDPTGAVRELAEVPGVVVTGRVEDVRPYTHDAAVCVAPMRIAQGIQNKVLEAMACGRPVVTTSKGNEGINALAGESIMVDDSPRGFAEKVVSLLLDRALNQAIAAAGRKFVEANFSWRDNMAKLEGILEDTHAAAVRKPW
jgi:sugar transferase (PEP-CTERM/EpsH1 system associated)